MAALAQIGHGHVNTMSCASTCMGPLLGSHGNTCRLLLTSNCHRPWFMIGTPPHTPAKLPIRPPAPPNHHIAQWDSRCNNAHMFHMAL